MEPPLKLVELLTNKPIRRLFILALVGVLLILVSADPQPQLESIIERGELRVGTRPGALTFYQRDGQPDGLEYHLIKAFADDLGVALSIVEINDIDELLNAAGGPRIDMVAASLTVTEQRRERFAFSRPYMEVTSQVIQRTDSAPVRSVADLVDRDLVVIRSSSHEEALLAMREHYPQLDWLSEPDIIQYELMRMVNDGEIELAVVDSSAYDLEHSFFPRIEAVLDLDDPTGIGWAFARTEDRSLLDAANEFLDRFDESGQLAALVDAIFGQVNPLTVPDTLTFTERLDDRLPEFDRLFKLVAQRHEMDWTLLAAIAYQESHWDPTATSPTGVRGLMMLTLPTAEHLGVSDRLDPLQSLDGGVRYLEQMRDKIPDRIEEPDRTRFALAAYNIGYAHLEDARVLTQRLGGNPDVWEDVEKHLPLLQKQEYYEQAKYGYARGAEAAAYVANIEKYHEILQWHLWRNNINESVREEVISDQDFRRLLESDFKTL